MKGLPDNPNREKYLKTKDCCPECGKTKLKKEKVKENEPGCLTRTIHCANCNFEWHEIYSFAGYTGHYKQIITHCMTKSPTGNVIKYSDKYLLAMELWYEWRDGPSEKTFWGWLTQQIEKEDNKCIVTN